MESNSIGRVVVGVNGSPGSLEALRYALAQARRTEAVLIPVFAWQPPGGALANRRPPSPQYTRLLREYAETELQRAFDQGLGGLPADVRIEPLVIMGTPGPALVQTAAGPADVLVVGAGRRSRLWRALRSATARYCLAHATCPVFAVPPSRLESALPRSLRHRRMEISHLLDDLARTGPAALPDSSATPRGCAKES